MSEAQAGDSGEVDFPDQKLQQAEPFRGSGAWVRRGLPLPWEGLRYLWVTWREDRRLKSQRLERPLQESTRRFPTAR